MDWLIDTIGNLPGKLVEFFQEVVDMITSVYESLCTFLGMLNDFDETIVAMTESCGTSEFVGMPIVDSIGMFRYLVGDIAFMMIYFSILIGCLFTIYKLVVLLFEGLDALSLQAYGVTSKNLFSNLVGKILNR